MTTFSPSPVCTLADIHAFEQAMPFEKRVPAQSIYDLFVSSAKNHPERIALTMIMTGAADEVPRRVNYRELLEMIRRTANMFAGIGKNRPGVAYMLPSLVETHATLWGAETAGYAVPINFLLQAEHIADLLQASGANILVALGPHPQLHIWEKALAIKKIMPQLILMRIAPPSTPAAEGVLDFHTTLQHYSGDDLQMKAGSGDDICAYFHTGGTTGTPKLVAHTHRSQIVSAFGGSVLVHMSEHDILTSGFPLFHVAGTIIGGLSCFMTGAEVLILSPAGFRNPAIINGFWHLIDKYKATLVGTVPTALGAILDTPIQDADLSSIRLGICGAASLPRAVGERFEQLTGKYLHEVLGMTESSGLTCIDPAGALRGPGSVGYPLPYTTVEIRQFNADGSLGEICQPEEIGVLTVRGPSVSPGYKKVAHNAGVFIDGLLNSGDLAYTDSLGRVYVAGRAKDLIIRSGHNIDPVMIENVMAKHPAVALVAAVAQPDAYAGEIPVCYLTLRPGAQVTILELQTHAQEHIAERPAWPKQIYLLDEMPITNVGKIYKPQLRVDATLRLVNHLISGQLGISGTTVKVREGGKRGMMVHVTLQPTHAAHIATITEALSGFVFESTVSVNEMINPL